MWNWFRSRRRHSAAHLPDLKTWRALCERLPPLARLNADQREALRQTCAAFLASRIFHGLQDLTLDPPRKLLIAAQAALPILELGIEWYRGWQTVLVYPSTFRVPNIWVDEAGVVHNTQDECDGEAWPDGPVLLAWEEIAQDHSDEGCNLIIHEMAHKLDMLNGGEANGFPPMHSEMSAAAWHRIWSEAYEDHCEAVDLEQGTWIDPYAAEAPAEFFAVLSELFFCAPVALRKLYPGLYGQLRAFYRQDPARY